MIRAAEALRLANRLVDATDTRARPSREQELEIIIRQRNLLQEGLRDLDRRMEQLSPGWIDFWD